MSTGVALIRYSEIGLKSTPVRRRLERQLVSHLKTSLRREGVNDFVVRRIQGRILVEGGDPETVAMVASKVFGVASASPTIKITSQMDEIVEMARDVAVRTLKNGQTFAVRARRVGEQQYTSQDVQVRVGTAILNRLASQNVAVNLGNPDVTIYIEVRNKSAYVYRNSIAGPGGFPFGSQGSLISLFSGGIDSPVATWFMMKRGASVKLLFLDQKPFVGEDYYRRAVEVAEKLGQYIPRKNYVLNVAPMGEVMGEIANLVPVRLTCIVCKRTMYRIACSLAERVNADGVVTGENLGQVASQTLSNLKVLDEVSKLPIYRPLIGFEKEEIVTWAKKIGTFEASIAPVHGCSSVPRKPVTKAKIEDILEVERHLPIERLVTRSLKRVTRVRI
jgi:thiamine biosynthesis protein ThiI